MNNDQSKYRVISFSRLLGICLFVCLSLFSADILAQSKKDEVKSGAVIKLTKDQFVERVADVDNTTAWKYLGDKPAILDFYASWCGPCRQIAPILEELAKEYKDEIYIYKIDTDKEKELARAFGIRSLPTLIFVPMDGQPAMAQGAMPKEEFEKAIKEYLLKKK